MTKTTKSRDSYALGTSLETGFHEGFYQTTSEDSFTVLIHSEAFNQDSIGDLS